MDSPTRFHPAGCALLALLGFFAISANAQTISGTVRDAQGSTPLVSMVVSIYTSAGTLQVNTTTDSGGRYQATLSPGGYRVVAFDPTGAYAAQFANDAPSFEE